MVSGRVNICGAKIGTVERCVEAAEQRRGVYWRRNKVSGSQTKANLAYLGVFPIFQAQFFICKTGSQGGTMVFLKSGKCALYFFIMSFSQFSRLFATNILTPSPSPRSICTVIFFNPSFPLPTGEAGSSAYQYP